MAAVATHINTGKRYTRWHELSEPPFCKKCDVFCGVVKTEVSGRSRVQSRKCPKCGGITKHAIRAA